MAGNNTPGGLGKNTTTQQQTQNQGGRGVRGNRGRRGNRITDSAKAPKRMARLFLAHAQKLAGDEFDLNGPGTSGATTREEYITLFSHTFLDDARIKAFTDAIVAEYNSLPK